MEFKDIFSWLLFVLFVLLGILNMVYIHPVPGIFYLFLALFYCPPLGLLIFRRLGFKIPYYMKIILALLVLWATLAVGDLVEYFESKFL